MRWNSEVWLRAGIRWRAVSKRRSAPVNCTLHERRRQNMQEQQNNCKRLIPVHGEKLSRAGAVRQHKARRVVRCRGNRRPATYVVGNV